MLYACVIGKCHLRDGRSIARVKRVLHPHPKRKDKTLTRMGGMPSARCVRCRLVGFPPLSSESRRIILGTRPKGSLFNRPRFRCRVRNRFASYVPSSAPNYPKNALATIAWLAAFGYLRSRSIAKWSIAAFVSPLASRDAHPHPRGNKSPRAIIIVHNGG